MTTTVTGLSEAIASIPDGSTIGVGGYFQHRHPMAAVRELIRQERTGFHVVTPLAGVECDMAIAGGLVGHLTYGFVSMDVYGQAPHFRRSIQDGAIGSTEYGDLALVRALEARQRLQPWIPVRAWLGSDIEPYHPGEPMDMGDGTSMWKVPALPLDWAIVHVPYATAAGDLALPGECYDALMVGAADHVIATTEQIVDQATLAERFNGRTIARYEVDHVLEVPYGAHPSSCFPFYVQDAAHLIDYTESAENDDFGTYRREWLGGSEQGYLDRVGCDRLADLTQSMSLAQRAAAIYR